jgi:protein arginine kinase
MSKWYSAQGNNSDVVLSSKIRLARNLEKTPFPCRMSNELRKSVCKKIFAALQNSKLAGEFDLIELSNLTDVKKVALVEKGLISPQMAKQSQYSAVLLSKDEGCSIMLCEEDHIRLSVMTAGEDLKLAYSKANEIDDIFINSMKIAFDEKLGFLTSNPMHLGTGLKASVTLHLPAIKERQMISTLSTMVGKLGFSIKPLYGGSGAFYELSNEISLGITEENAIDNLVAICDQITTQERKFRDELMQYADFEDKIFRAMGTLKMARKLSTKEFYDLISLVRLGISSGSFDISYEKIGNMISSLGTASIISQSDDSFSVDDADKVRAQYVRENIE